MVFGGALQHFVPGNSTPLSHCVAFCNLLAVNNCNIPSACCSTSTKYTAALKLSCSFRCGSVEHSRSFFLPRQKMPGGRPRKQLQTERELEVAQKEEKKRQFAERQVHLDLELLRNTKLYNPFILTINKRMPARKSVAALMSVSNEGEKFDETRCRK